jgi:DNA-binding NtrC family response regulator
MASAPSTSARIIVVDDEEQILHLLADYLEQAGFEVHCEPRGADALERIEKSHFDILICDMKMPGMDGLEVLRRAREIDENISAIVMTGYGTMDSAVRAMKLGAEDYLLKPLELEALTLAITRTLGHRALRMDHMVLRARVATLEQAHGIIGRGKPMLDILALVAKIAPLRSTVLIQGESGTGKELLARAIHAGSPRADRPFVAINCGVIPLNLLESELFGHERGAFTGAESRRIGYFEAAAGGTIFLDEISETSLDLQVKLLRVLQERVFRRVGGTDEIATDARVIVSTNRNLEEEVRNNRFRQDLYYRLNVIILAVPPLRERAEDISVLAYHFLAKYGEEFGKPMKGIAPGVMERLLSHRWPGNVRELENIIERAVAVADGPEIDLRDIDGFAGQRTAEAPKPEPSATIKPYAEAKEAFETTYVHDLLAQANGNVTEASRIAGIARQNLYQKMKKLGIEP